ncbi:MAG: SLC13 family permease [Sulfolobales archaeon]
MRKAIAKLVKMVGVLATCFLLSSVIVVFLNVPHDGVGGELRKTWEDIRGGLQIDSPIAVFEGVISLGLFLFTIAVIALDMRYRYFLALLAVSIIVFLGVTPPQRLVESVDWALIVFLVGSMSFATILRKLGVFTYLAAYIVKYSKGNAFMLTALLSALAWFTAMVVDEVTSIVYIVMIVLELGRLLKIETEDLVILSVLATNTGSLALPVGNPIGVYVAFTSGFTAREFVRYALPLSFLCFISTLLIFSMLRVRYLKDLEKAIASRSDMFEAFITARIVDVSPREKMARTYGVVLLTMFLVTVSLSPVLAEGLSAFAGYHIDPNSLLALTPCLYIVLTLPVIGAPELGEVLAKGVEWPSLTFFMFLFMLGYSLTWSGAMVKVAYATITLSQSIYPGPHTVLVILLTISAILSAFLDNLSLVVALIPAVKLVAQVMAFKGIYWSVLFGGVLGGNLTPVGSTANIVAVSIIERKRKTRINWSNWLKISLPVFAAHIVIASTWSFLAL